MSAPFHIAAFYHFTPLDHAAVNTLCVQLKAFGKEQNMRGLVLIAHEGINGTVCGSAEAIDAWKQLLTERFGPMRFNDSTAATHVFPRWLVKIKQEIVAIKRDDIQPSGPDNHLTPQEWEQMMNNDDVVIIDTRNDYEYEMGAFKGAINPGIKHFSEFPAFVQKSGIPKDKKVMMYCTGGIRCEKALVAMKKEGYKNVFQLSGGILGYLKALPNKSFEGECFVFDHRVGVDQELKPSSTFGLCSHCGCPAKQEITCSKCSTPAMICVSCVAKGEPHACSKNCRHQLMKQAVMV